MTEARDYVTLGTNRMPDGMRKANALAYLSVYLHTFTATETAFLQVLDAFAEWNRSTPRYSFVLDAIGRLIGQPRPDGFNDIDYLSVLVARTIVRGSKSQRSDIVRLIAYLSTLNGGLGNYSVFAGPPEHWDIVIFDAVLTEQWQDVYARLIFDAIGVTDSFRLTVGTAGTAIYDDESTLYDVSLYP